MRKKTELKRTGNDPTPIESAGAVRSGETTSDLGPFSVNEVHAEAACGVKLTLSQNYHSATLEVYVKIPCEATPEGVRAGYNWCKETVYTAIDADMADVRDALTKIAKASGRQIHHFLKVMTKPKATHTHFRTGKRVYVRMRSGEAFIDNFVERWSASVEFKHRGRISISEIVSITIYRDNQRQALYVGFYGCSQNDTLDKI